MMLHFHRAYSIYLWLIDFVLSIYLLRFWKYMDLAFRKHSTCIFFFLFRNDLGIRVLYVQFSSVTQLCPLFVTPWATTCQASLSITNSQSLSKLMSTESVMPSNHLILCHPLRLPPSVIPSIKVFSNESALHIRWPKYWSFSFNIVLPMNTQDWSPLVWTIHIHTYLK